MPDTIESSDDGPAGFFTNGSDAEDDLDNAFQHLVLEEDNIVFYGAASPFADLEAPERPKPRLPATEGFQHSTSRMHHIRPLHELEGPPERDSINWDKYLPKNDEGKCLITRDEHDQAIDPFFRFFTSWGLRIIPHFFLRDLAIAVDAPDPKPQINHYSPFLHNVLVGISLAFSDNVALRERRLRDRFISEGKSKIDEECQRPTLSTVQALALLSSYYSGMGEQTLGFMYFGEPDWSVSYSVEKL